MTVLPDNPLAPGCFGSALTFREDAVECKTCTFAAECGPISQRRMAMLRADLGIPEPPKRTRKIAKPIANGEALTRTLPVKVEALMRGIEQQGIRVTEALARGENPFKDRFVFLKVACHLLLRMHDGVTRETLTQAFERKLNWSRGTAAAHALQAFQTLTALGAAAEVNGRLTLRR